VQSHAHPHARVLRPGVRCERPLHLPDGCCRSHRVRPDDEEAVAVRPDLVSTGRGDRRAQDRVMLREHLCEVVPGVEQPGAALDVREQQREMAVW